MLSLGEGGIAAQQDLPESAASADIDGVVQPRGGAVIGLGISRTVHDDEWFIRVRERHEQGVVAPLALVRAINPIFALRRRLDDGAIDVEHGLLEEAPRLLTPSSEPDFVDRLDECLDLLISDEAATEVTGCRRVRQACHTQAFEQRIVLAQLLEVFEAAAPGQRVQGDRQNVIGLVVRKVPLQQRDVSIQCGCKPKPMAQEQRSAEAAD